MGRRPPVLNPFSWLRLAPGRGEIYEEVEAAAIKKVIAAVLARQMTRQGVSVSALAEKLGTSRAALNRVLDEDNAAITLTRLSRIAAALGCRVNLQIVAAR